jgi:hypothetical protein
MYDLGVGISMVFDIFGDFLFKGGHDHPHMVMTYISSDVPEHKNQEYVWFRIGI